MRTAEAPGRTVVADIVGAATDTTGLGCNSVEGNSVEEAEVEVIEDTSEADCTVEAEDEAEVETGDWNTIERVIGMGDAGAGADSEVDVEVVEKAEMVAAVLGDEGNWCTCH